MLLGFIELARSLFKPQHSTCIERKTDVWRTEIKILPCCSDPSHHCKNQICSVRVFRLLQLFSTSLSWAPLSSIRATQRVGTYSSPRPLMYYIRAQHCMNLLSLKTIFIRKDFPRKKRQPNFKKMHLLTLKNKHTNQSNTSMFLSSIDYKHFPSFFFKKEIPPPPPLPAHFNCTSAACYTQQVRRLPRISGL